MKRKSFVVMSLLCAGLFVCAFGVALPAQAQSNPKLPNKPNPPAGGVKPPPVAPPYPGQVPIPGGPRPGMP